jgi:hypothetical protein
MAITYKTLGQVAPANTDNADLYTVPTSTSTVVSTLHIANVTASEVAARVYVVPASGSASDANAIAKDSPIPANGFLAITTGITLGAGDKLIVRSATGNALTFHAFGSEVN